MTTKTATLADTEKALKDTRRELQLLEAQYLAAGNDLGDALAKVRTEGGKAAEAAAAKASMRRAELERERDKLALEEAALIGQLQAMQDAERERIAAEALPAFEDVTAESRELERQFAEILQTAAEVGQKLRAIQKPWKVAYRAALQAGHHVDAEAPRIPADLIQIALLDDPETRLKRWLGPSAWRQARERAKQPHVTHFKKVDRPANGGEHVVYAIEDFPYRGGAA